MVGDPHGNQSVLHRGAPPAEARLVMIMVHGRGASAEDILGLAAELRLDDIAFYAPQAAGGTWYPYSFLSPIAQNEPGMTSGLRKLGAIVDELGQKGVPPARIGLLGFSQGACLSLEYAARHARRYWAVVGLSGGVIGPPGTPRDDTGSMDGTPVFLGCSDIDAHIPVDRVHETADVFRTLGANVDERIYPGMGHTINPDEVDAVRALLEAR